MLILFEKELEPFILDLPGFEGTFGPPYYSKKFSNAAWFDSNYRKEVEKALEPALDVFGLKASFVDIDSHTGLMCFLEEKG